MSRKIIYVDIHFGFYASGTINRQLPTAHKRV